MVDVATTAGVTVVPTKVDSEMLVPKLVKVLVIVL